VNHLQIMVAKEETFKDAFTMLLLYRHIM